MRGPCDFRCACPRSAHQRRSRWGPKFRYQWRCGAPWLLTDNRDTNSASYFTDDAHTYPYPIGSAKDGASTWVEATVYVEDTQGNLSPLGFVGGMAELRYSASFYMVAGGCMGETIVRNNCQLNVSRHPLSRYGWNSATYWFRGLRTGDKLTLRMMVQSIPQGQQQALASTGPLYLYGSVMGADGKQVTRCDKISDGISKLLAYGETYTQIITIPAG